MEKFISVFICTLLFSLPVYSQSLENNKSYKEQMEKLSFLVGEWEGMGWMMGGDGTKHPFSQTENIQFKLDSTAILIEGIGKSEGKIIHNALAVVRFNQQEENYTFNSYLSTGQSGEFKAELIDGRFYWYPNQSMRYIIEMNEEDQWYETGEINRDGRWVQFFEMTLDKALQPGN